MPRIDVVAKLAKLLPEAQRVSILDQAVEDAKTIVDRPSRLRAFAALGMQPPAELWDMALREARDISEQYVRAFSLIELAARLPDIARVWAYRSRLLAWPSYARALDEARPYRHLFPLGAPEGRD